VRVFLAVSLVVGLFAVGCVTPREAYVSEATARGPYIDATFSGPSRAWRFLFPRSEACAAVLRPEAAVSYQPGGIWGSFHAADGEVCEPVGIGSLRQWRSRRPRVEGAMSERSPSDWEVLHRDAQVYLLRGRFPVASFIGMAGTWDTVAMVPNDGGRCSRVAEGGNAILEYRTSGSEAFLLGGCPVLAFANPPAGSG